MKFRDEIKFLIYCMSKCKDTRFVRNVYEIGDGYNMVNLERGNGQSMGEAIYYILMEPSYSGFFADHNKLLALLYFADYYGLTPVVEYGKDYCYAEKHLVDGTMNPFEYYFLQPADISIKEAKKYSHIICSRKENTRLAGKYNEKNIGYGMSEEYIKEMGKISNQYIRLNEKTKSIIFKDIDSLIESKKCIGVHVRGTDFKHNYNGHPIRVSSEEYLDSTIKLLNKGNYETVFLATDDLEAIALFQSRLGNKVYFYDDVIRSNGSETVMKSVATRENHYYKLGLEVMRDMYTLASCEALIAGLSQVSYAARIQKYAQNQVYKDLLILNKGLNNNGDNCPK